MPRFHTGPGADRSVPGHCTSRVALRAESLQEAPAMSPRPCRRAVFSSTEFFTNAICLSARGCERQGHWLWRIRLQANQTRFSCIPVIGGHPSHRETSGCWRRQPSRNHRQLPAPGPSANAIVRNERQRASRADQTTASLRHCTYANFASSVSFTFPLKPKSPSGP